LRDEAAAFTEALGNLPGPAWSCPTRCDPWSVRDVVGHVITVLARVPDMVLAPAPERPDTTAITYYRADERFSEAGNAARVETARRRANLSDTDALVHDLADISQQIVAVCGPQPSDRVVRTRHGDAMLLSDFLATRVFETAVHGLDVADALDRPPWLTDAAAEHLQQALFGSTWRESVATLGWDPAVLLRAATGRAQVTGEESALLADLGMRRLAVG
jgi:uncharacterized protein (TIGR03083 family)